MVDTRGAIAGKRSSGGARLAAHHGRCGTVGIGGSVGNVGVAVGTGVTGGADTVGTGGFVAEGCAVGAVVGAVVGACVADGGLAGRAVAFGVAADPGNDDDEVACGVLVGALVEREGGSSVAGRWSDPASVRPASAIATAIEGPRSTYKVKDARPARPGTKFAEVPSVPTGR